MDRREEGARQERCAFLGPLLDTLYCALPRIRGAPAAACDARARAATSLRELPSHVVRRRAARRTLIPSARTLKQAESNLAATSPQLWAQADGGGRGPPLDAASAKLKPNTYFGMLSPDSAAPPSECVKKDKDTILVMFDSPESRTRRRWPLPGRVPPAARQVKYPGSVKSRRTVVGGLIATARHRHPRLPTALPTALATVALGELLDPHPVAAPAAMQPLGLPCRLPHPT